MLTDVNVTIKGAVADSTQIVLSNKSNGSNVSGTINISGITLTYNGEEPSKILDMVPNSNTVLTIDGCSFNGNILQAACTNIQGNKLTIKIPSSVPQSNNLPEFTYLRLERVA